MSHCGGSDQRVGQLQRLTHEVLFYIGGDAGGDFVIQSMSRKGDCWDNAVAESFFHKSGLTYHCRWLNYQAAYRSLFEYIEIFYIRERSHSTPYYVSSDQFEPHISTIAA